jgi:hypothetical protein
MARPFLSPISRCKPGLAQSAALRGRDKADIVTKSVGDFRGWKNADDYSRAFKRFLHALNRPHENPKPTRVAS